MILYLVKTVTKSAKRCRLLVLLFVSVPTIVRQRLRDWPKKKGLKGGGAMGWAGGEIVIEAGDNKKSKVPSRISKKGG